MLERPSLAEQGEHLRSFTVPRPAVAAFAGLTLVGALAGCTAATSTGVAADAARPATAAPGGSAGSTGTGSFRDGNYTESGDYQAPSGTETVDVTLTLAGGVVTAVSVVGRATDPQARLHQSQFAKGVGTQVVGKKISDLKVDKVGGSSLTGIGFNAAVAHIKTDAST